MTGKSAIGGGKSTSDTNVHWGLPAASILRNPSVTQATDLVVMVRGTDGKPEIYCSGDQDKFQSLFREAGQLAGAREFSA